MKHKNLNPIEKHFEKLIVAITAILFVVTLSLQFTGQPNKVTIGTELTPVRPGGAYPIIRYHANQLSARMLDPAPTLPDPPNSDIAAPYRNEVGDHASPRPRLTTGIPAQVVPFTDSVGGDIAHPRFVPLIPPAPTDLAAAVTTNTINPLVVRQYPRLAEFLPSQQPFDKSVVTIEASFNGQALKTLLLDDPEGPLMPMRPNWWRNNLHILSIRLEREQRTTTGEWTDLRAIEPIPGAPNPLDLLLNPWLSARELQTIAQSASRQSDQILRPAYYPTIAGPEWHPPSDRDGPVESGRVDPTPLLLSESLLIWAHDITAQPGQTYRYRLAVVMNNPAFGRAATLAQDQKHLAREPLAIGRSSDWTDPIDIDRAECFFVTAARPDAHGPLDHARATIEIFRFYYGYWRRNSRAFEPGDPIAATIRLTNDLYTFDLDSPELAGQKPPPQADEASPPDWWIKAPTALQTNANAQLLDISRVVSSQSDAAITTRPRMRYAAIFQEDEAGLFAQVPRARDTHELYGRLVESANQGLEQSTPRLTPAPKAPITTPNTEPKNDDPSKPDRPGDG